MSYRISVPLGIKQAISSTGWKLSRTLIVQVYARFHGELAARHKEVCQRTSAPSPTFLYQFTLNDDRAPGFLHHFTFHLTYGGEATERVLVIRQAWHDWMEDRGDEEE